MDISTVQESHWIESEEWSVAGQVFRIVEILPPSSLKEGGSVSEQHVNVATSPSHPLAKLRKWISEEPRGHSGMTGGFIVPPNDPEAHLGVLFWHNDGFIYNCGHGVMALACWAVKKGLVEIKDGNHAVDVKIDTPCGRSQATVILQEGTVVSVEFFNPLSYKVGAVCVTMDSGTRYAYNLIYAGPHAVYASFKVQSLYRGTDPDHIYSYIKRGREIKRCIGNLARNWRHSEIDHEVDGVIFYKEDEGKPGEPDENTIRQTNIVFFGERQIDRSPCVLGTCARVAQLLQEGKIGPGRSKLLNQSVHGAAFEAEVVSEEKMENQVYPSCTIRVRGTANLVGTSKFFV